MSASTAERSGIRRHNLSALLAPRAVAVVGANDRPEAFTGGSVFNLKRHGFEGRIYPVNPRRSHVGDLLAYPSLADLPTSIDLAVIAIRAGGVVDALEQAVEAGAKAAIVVSSGFGEGVADDGGRTRASELARFLARAGLPILGPSTTGLVNLNDGFVPRAVNNQLAPEHVRPGPIALISQSGAANNAVFNRAQSHGLGVGLAVATGVQANVDVWDVAVAAIDDPRIRVLAVLVEDLGSPHRYEPVLRMAAQAEKPVVLLRAGRSAVGSAAIATHTGSFAGNWRVEREMLAALGVTLVHDLDQLWEVASICLQWGQPPADRLRLGVIGLSGGEGALIADLAADAGLDLPDVSDQFKKLVGENLDLAGAGNPFDPTGEVIGRPEAGLTALNGFVTTNSFDAHLLALNAQSLPTEGGFLDQVMGAFDSAGARIAVSHWEIPGFSDGLIERLGAFPGPVLPGSHRAIEAIAAWARTRRCAPPRQRAEQRANGPQLTAPVSYWGARQALEACGIPFATAHLVRSEREACEAAVELGYPLVLKANVDSATHKSTRGLVRIGIRDESQLIEHFGDLSGHGNGVVVERSVIYSEALILGTSHDAHVGPVVVVGSGGSMTEFLDDTALCPTRLITPDAARATLERTAIGRFLAKTKPSAFAHVTELMLRLASAAEGRRLSIDLNPIVITGSDVVAIDARIEQLSQGPE